MTATTQPDDVRTKDAFDAVNKYVTLFGAIGAITLGTVAVMALSGQNTNPFMWIRAVILFLAAFMLHRFTAEAARGVRKSFDRLRTLSVILPIAIVGVDLIPGVCPAWYTVLQGLSALALVAVAVLTRTRSLRAAAPAEN
ncbi:hypothetical protein AB0J52_08860 [Spirillospora sp. NPDC049652]